ncbi:MAG: hypothetical protein ABH859_04925 [Pseudomonadota bacterium]
MKVIIIAGAGSKVGKTTVLRSLKAFFPNSISVKLGKKEAEDKNKEELLLPSNSTLAQIKAALSQEPEYLLIEGNALLKTFKPDLAIFVDGEPEKPREDAKELQIRSHLVVGTKVDCQQAFILAGRIGLERAKFGQLLNKLKIKVQKCQLGCF